MKNIRVFLSENFQFSEVKLSIYLNRRVFVMAKTCLRAYADSKGQDQPAHPCSLLMAFTVC